MALGGILLSSSYKRSSARALGCEGGASCSPQRRRVYLERKRLATVKQNVEGLGIAQKRDILTMRWSSSASVFPTSPLGARTGAPVTAAR
jgi:hypothetical protein